MYELRKGDVPEGFHVHHKCENSACVNPRHLVALSPEAHRAVHSTKDKALKERIYAGEWKQLQAAKAEAARLEREQERLAREQYEREKHERRRIAAEQMEDYRQLTEVAERWRREHPGLVDLQRAKYLLIGLVFSALICLVLKLTFSDSHTDGWTMFFGATFWIIAGLALIAIGSIRVAFNRDVPLPSSVESEIKASISARRNTQRSGAVGSEDNTGKGESSLPRSGGQAPVSPEFLKSDDLAEAL